MANPSPRSEQTREIPKRRKLDSQTQTQERVKADCVYLPDPDVLDCPICFESLAPPVLQCENGHITCSACCTKLKNKCSSCNAFIGSNRCRAIERVLESAKVVCPNIKYGCKETISFLKKRDHQLNECLHAPCSCPISDCNYVGLSKQLYRHFSKEHKNSALPFQFNEVFRVNLNDNGKSIILREEKDGVLFILHNCTTQPHWNLVSVSCIASPTEEGMYYDLAVKEKADWRSNIKLQSVTFSFRNRDEVELEADDPKAYGLLPVPHYLTGFDKKLELDICIWGPGIHPDVNKI